MTPPVFAEGDGNFAPQSRNHRCFTLKRQLRQPGEEDSDFVQYITTRQNHAADAVLGENMNE